MGRPTGGTEDASHTEVVYGGTRSSGASGVRSMIYGAFRGSFSSMECFGLGLSRGRLPWTPFRLDWERAVPPNSETIDGGELFLALIS